MAKITFKGSAVSTSGQLPAVGSVAPDFSLLSATLERTSRAAFQDKRRVILNIFPSIDTGVCAMSVRAFNEKMAGLDNAAVLCISEDLVFAQKRFCGAEGIDNVVALSAFRSTFAQDYGVEMLAGPLAGLCARAVVVTDGAGKILYTELVPEITQEPDYDAALAAAAG